MCVTIQENLVVAIELLEGFVNAENILASMKEQREKVLVDLLIDCYYKFGELCHFQELFEESIPYFGKVTELCATIGKGSFVNMKTLATAFFQIGSSYTQLKKQVEAGLNYKNALDMLKIVITSEYKQIVPTFDSKTVTNEWLIQPSIFDNDELRGLRGFYIDILERIEESTQNQEIDKKLEEIRKEEKEQHVAVDENFGKVQPNADQFKMIQVKSKLGEKRTYNQAKQEQKEVEPTPKEESPEDSLKRRKLADGVGIPVEQGNNSDKENTSKNTL